MKILYDISALGLGYYNQNNRAGIFRVVENIAQRLYASQEVSLKFCATEFNFFYTHNACVKYLNSNRQFEKDLFEYPISQRLFYKAINKTRQLCTNRVQENEKFWLLCNLYKGLYKTTNYISQLGNSIIPPIASGSLEGIDIYHSTLFKMHEQVRKHKNIKRFLTVYDLIPILYPDFFDIQSGDTHFLEEVLNDLQHDDWIICISESSKRDLCEYKNIDPERVFVSHLAADSAVFYPCRDDLKKKSLFEKYNIPEEPYFLGLSTLEPRKNITHTILCFLKLIEQENMKNLNLVLVGAKGWKYQKIFEVVKCQPEFTDRIIFVGFVEDEDLAVIYSYALAFVYMSFYEGFGLPPLEAMNCGIPVITSNTSSLPEVVGDAGIMLPPNDSDQLCQKLLEVYNGEDLRSKFARKSIESSKKFTWDKTLKTTIDAYKVAMSS